MSKMRMPLLIAGAFIAGVVGTYLVTAPERVTAENSIATALAIGTSVTPDVCVAKARRQALSVISFGARQSASRTVALLKSPV